MNECCDKTYVCPESGERECPVHGGFKNCCDHPDCPGNKRLRKIAAGRYGYRGRYVLRTDWEGPRGGTIWRWEMGRDDRHGELFIDGLNSYSTRRDAMAEPDKVLG